MQCDKTRDIRTAAIRLLAQREHSQRELIRKLSQRFGDDGQVAAGVAQLAQEGLQSDTRFSEAFVAMRRRKGQGPVRIRLELEQRGICSNLIDSYLDESDSCWLELAREVHAKRFGEVARDSKALARQMRFLQYRGFSPQQIRAALATD